MFPNDDICDVNAAKDAARRIFSRYNKGESGAEGMGRQEVSRLMKATYEAINMPYDPNEQDVFSFIDVFDSKKSGNIQLEDVETMAVKYLCGEEALDSKQKSPKNNKEQRSLPSIKQEPLKPVTSEKSIIKDIKKEEVKIETVKWQPKIAIKRDLQIKVEEAPTVPKAFVYTPVNQRPVSMATFYSPKNRTISKDSSSTGIQTVKSSHNFDGLLQKGRQIFEKMAEGAGIREGRAAETLSQSYKLLGRLNYKPSEDDVRIWMRLCDRNNDGVVEWSDYQHFLTRTAERQGFAKS